MCVKKKIACWLLGFCSLAGFSVRCVVKHDFCWCFFLVDVRLFSTCFGRTVKWQHIGVVAVERGRHLKEDAHVAKSLRRC